jgi:formate hydrogenlyase subunit 6/NADH:ubiquinone oxidoreductase subunit I
MIKVDLENCLGCSSCSNVCPNKFIIRNDYHGKRSISFKKCMEECDLCVEFCPAKILTLVPESNETTLTFELVSCRVCGSCYATEQMLERIESTLPSNLQKDSAGLAWIRICPTCRRNIEAERATKQLVLERGRRGFQI